MVCQRFGYGNIYDPFHPEMHYQLRMARPDESKVGKIETDLLCLFD